ncbi:MAG: hypothetical protein ACFE94_19945 [Candidatus Hodarchaeota archaeon]
MGRSLILAFIYAKLTPQQTLLLLNFLTNISLISFVRILILVSITGPKINGVESRCISPTPPTLTSITFKLDIENQIYEAIKIYLERMINLEIELPYFIYITFTSIEGFTITLFGLENHYHFNNEGNWEPNRKW